MIDHTMPMSGPNEWYTVLGNICFICFIVLIIEQIIIIKNLKKQGIKNKNVIISIIFTIISLISFKISELIFDKSVLISDAPAYSIIFIFSAVGTACLVISIIQLAILIKRLKEQGTKNKNIIISIVLAIVILISFGMKCITPRRTVNASPKLGPWYISLPWDYIVR